ncbi:MAG: membrane protein insertion efficiency factor YidD [Prochlorotrichaceae cyanobacterium]|jgi:putative component of membrane protein insertase Oxa1/YidC/SpoIIIJ protein YidD
MFNLQVFPHNSLRIPEKLRRGSRQVAVETIAFYQRYLSPLKGYHCAHRQLYGGLSCSEYVKQTIAAQGIRRSLPLCHDRFQACRQALDLLQAQQTLRANLRQIGKTGVWAASEANLEGNIPSEGTLPEDEPPAETITKGEYYPDQDFQPPTPPPNPLASCCLCGAVDVCCGGPVSAGGMGCGDPLASCSCCWSGCNLDAVSCCL